MRTSELVAELGVSPMTVRRDIDLLADAGSLRRVHGGAAVAGGTPSTSSDEPAFALKSVRQEAQKRAIAREAAALVRPGSSVALTAGSTTAALAIELANVPDIFVFTNSLAVPELISADDGRTVVVAGGSVTRSRALVGPIAEGSVAGLHVDTVFVGVHGMASSAGFTTPNMLEAQIVRRMVDAAERVVVLADHTKWGVVGLQSIMPLERADVVVTDQGIADPAHDELVSRVADVRRPSSDVT